MTSLADALPPQVAQQIHPHWRKNEAEYWAIRRDLQQQLVKEGYGMRVYIPFGTEWYPYFMRRLAERPANAMFVLKNLFK